MKLVIRHRLVIDSVEITGDTVQVKAHCACGVWTCNLPAVPVSTDWRFQVRDAYRQHHKKNLRLKRSSIDAALNKLVERVEAINRNEDLTHRVTAVVLFGSCLTDKEHPGDVDIAVDLAFRFPPDSPAYDEAREKMIQRWQPQFYSSFDWIEWPWRKVRQLIKDRSTMLSIHEIGELKPRKAPYRVLYGNPAEIAAKLGYYPLPHPNCKPLESIE